MYRSVCSEWKQTHGPPAGGGPPGAGQLVAGPAVRGSPPAAQALPALHLSGSALRTLQAADTPALGPPSTTG